MINPKNSGDVVEKPTTIYPVVIANRNAKYNTKRLFCLRIKESLNYKNNHFKYNKNEPGKM